LLPFTSTLYAAANAQQGMKPLRIGQVACVTLPSSLILQTSDFSPRIVPHRLLDTTIQSQLTQITQFISGQPLLFTPTPSAATPYLPDQRDLPDQRGDRSTGSYFSTSIRPTRASRPMRLWVRWWQALSRAEAMAAHLSGAVLWAVLFERPGRFAISGNSLVVNPSGSGVSLDANMTLNVTIVATQWDRQTSAAIARCRRPAAWSR
jgi:hypothetical protein